MKIFISFFILISFNSCAGYKWKEKYINKHVSTYKEKYNVDNAYDFQFSSNKSYLPLSKQSRKEVRLFVRDYEVAFALIPDSVYTNSETTDSFYTNTHKINYITGHQLQTRNKHLLMSE